EQARVEPDAAADVQHAVAGGDAGGFGALAVQPGDALVRADVLQVLREGLGCTGPIDVLKTASEKPIRHPLPRGVGPRAAATGSRLAAQQPCSRCADRGILLPRVR